MKLRLGTYRLRMTLSRRLAPRSALLSRRLRYPYLFRAPWRRAVVDVARSGSDR